MAAIDEKPAIDNSSRVSDAEQDVVGDGANKVVLGLEDPDAGLSDEERARIVCTRLGLLQLMPLLTSL